MGRLLGRFLPKLTKTAISVGKNLLAPLGLSAAMSATDAAIQKKMYGSGTTVLFSNEEIDDIIKIVEALEDSNVLLKRVTKTLQHDIKQGVALAILLMLLGTLAPSLLTGRGLFRAGSGNKCNCHQGQGMYRAGKELFRAGQGVKKNNSCQHTP